MELVGYEDDEARSHEALASLVVHLEDLANYIGLTADKIKSGEEILGITGTYTG